MSIKRIFDIVFIILVCPLILLILLFSAIAIKLSSPGPVFFIQVRCGINGKKFKAIKFRTMIVNAESKGAGLYAEKDDPRFTRIGKFFRRFSLDEIPQFWNILKEDMSLIGPRPMVPEITNRYQKAYITIMKVKPGLTGISQVTGRNEIPRSKRLELDKWYAINHSWKTDFNIFFKTLIILLAGSGQCQDQSEQDVEK